MPTISKTLYVGLGGTGVKAILRTKQCFMDAYGEIPQMIGFLAIDTNIAARNESVLDSKGNPVTLNPTEICVVTDLQAYTKYMELKPSYPWMPVQNVNALSTIVADGAGQVRSNGRFICNTNYITIRTALTNKINQLGAPVPHGYRFEIDVDPNTGAASQTVVNVVGSIAGGTGSGMIIDVLALLEQGLQTIGSSNVEIRPWLVLPDIFRQQFPGPLSFNVFKNGYGALRELDHLLHWESSQSPINFHYASLRGLQYVKYAFVISNQNSIQTLDKIDDVTDSIGRSMFLPAAQVGGAIDGIMSNVRGFVINCQFNIPLNVTPNKKAWAVSAGSAELVYDSSAVASVAAFQLTKSVCDNLISLPAINSAASSAAAWMLDPNVAIEEDEHDCLIDSLNPSVAGPTISFDEDNANAEYIDRVITNALSNSGVLGRYNSKLAETQKELTSYIEKGLKSANGVAVIREFLKELVVRISECEKQMSDEIQNEFSLARPEWNNLLPSIKRSGLSATLMGAIIKEEADSLSSTVARYTKSLLEKQRREYANLFFAALKMYIADWDKKLANLVMVLDQIAINCSSSIVTKQNSAKDSCFRIYLHRDDMKKDIRDDSDIISFLQAIDVVQMLNQDQNTIAQSILDWAQKQDKVTALGGISIEDALRAMPKSKVEEYLKELKKKAMPLWTYNSLSLEQNVNPRAEFSVLGLEKGVEGSIFDPNQPDGIHYANIFSSITKGHQYVATQQNDRIVAMMMVASAPIYAVCNIKAYEAEYNAEGGVVGYLDSQWDMRIKSEHSTLIPVIDSGVDPVTYWVKGIVLGLIHHDDKTNEYWVKSVSNGDPLKAYRFTLGENREFAYSKFESISIYKEIKNEIDKMLRTQGIESIQHRFDSVSVETYLESHSLLNAEEKTNMSDSAHYGDLCSLLRKEISFIQQAKLTV